MHQTSLGASNPSVGAISDRARPEVDEPRDRGSCVRGRLLRRSLRLRSAAADSSQRQLCRCIASDQCDVFARRGSLRRSNLPLTQLPPPFGGLFQHAPKAWVHNLPQFLPRPAGVQRRPRSSGRGGPDPPMPHNLAQPRPQSRSQPRRKKMAQAARGLLKNLSPRSRQLCKGEIASSLPPPSAETLLTTTTVPLHCQRPVQCRCEARLFAPKQSPPYTTAATFRRAFSTRPEGLGPHPPDLLPRPAGGGPDPQSGLA